MRLPVLEQQSFWPVSGIQAGPADIRSVRVLRISLTDRCNFRCIYCMPASGVPWLPKNNLLSFEEVCQVVRAAVEIHNIRRFKLTGGEPTVRNGLCELVRMLRRINGIEDLSLTTNGALLEELAHPLKQAGLDRVTVSLDSLRHDRFRQITRTGDLSKVIRGLDAAEEAGLVPLKINCVTMRGINDDEIPEFARLTLTRRLTVRFIEYMPLGQAALTHYEPGPSGGCGAQHRGQDVLVPQAYTRMVIESALGPLTPVDSDHNQGVGPARLFRLARGNPRGLIGFISAMSEPFCSTCNRLRLTADGVLRSCLFDGGEVSIRSLLRHSPAPGERLKLIADAMSQCVKLKPSLHSAHGNQQMNRVGG